MKNEVKACPCVVENDKVLAFEHPNAGCQIPKGSVEKNEDIETAVLRELCEESGISTGRIVRKVGELDWVVEPGATTFTQSEHQQWHIYLVDPGTQLPDTWLHRAEGSEAEDGLVFRYFRQSLENVPVAFHPVYRQVIEMLAVHFGRR